MKRVENVICISSLNFRESPDQYKNTVAHMSEICTTNKIA